MLPDFNDHTYKIWMTCFALFFVAGCPQLDPDICPVFELVELCIFPHDDISSFCLRETLESETAAAAAAAEASGKTRDVVVDDDERESWN